METLKKVLAGITLYLFISLLFFLSIHYSDSYCTSQTLRDLSTAGQAGASLIITAIIACFTLIMALLLSIVTGTFEW